MWAHEESGSNLRQITLPAGWGWARTRGVCYLSREVFTFYLRVINLQGHRQGWTQPLPLPPSFCGGAPELPFTQGMSQPERLPVRASLQHKLVSGQNGNTPKKVAISKAFLASGISLLPSFPTTCSSTCARARAHAHSHREFSVPRACLAPPPQPSPPPHCTDSVGMSQQSP